MLKVVTALALAFALSACATKSTVEDAPIGAGVERIYNGDLATVREAARDTLQRDMPVTMTGVREQDGATVFSFEIAVSAFSWGEVGRVVVMDADPETTRVIINATRRSQMQVTGHGQAELAERLFSGVERRLAAR